MVPSTGYEITRVVQSFHQSAFIPPEGGALKMGQASSASLPQNVRRRVVEVVVVGAVLPTSSPAIAHTFAFTHSGSTEHKMRFLIQKIHKEPNTFELGAFLTR